MTAPPAYPAGTFCWVDLATTDPAAAKRFYASLLGWTVAEPPAGAGPAYVTVYRHGLEVGAMLEMSAGMRQQGVSPHWRSYVSVDNVDEIAQRASALDAAVMMPPFDVTDAGRMSLVQDPAGAGLCLWEPRNHPGARVVNEPGAMCWHELRTRDVDAALGFYGALFGWTSRAVTVAGIGDYQVLLNDERPAAGILRMPPQGSEVPPGWQVYFGAGDCREAVERATASGGGVIVPPARREGIGTFAFLRDPQGAAFAVLGTVHGAAHRDAGPPP